MKENDIIYLDQNGYEQYLKSIDDLKERIKDVNKGRKEAFDAGAGDGWDSPEFEEIERNENMLSGELSRMLSNLSKIVIVEKHNNEEIVDIGDCITVDLIYDEFDEEEYTFILVGGKGTGNGDLEEVTLSSPLGQAVYKKKVGEKSSYIVNGNSIQVLIKNKKNTIDEDVSVCRR